MEFILAIILSGAILLIMWLLIQWGDYKKLQRAISLADKATNFINGLDGKKTEFKTIEMREVIESLQHASRVGSNNLKNKGSNEL